jgi:formate hydrogenlyase subunit 3/multisubunit Na+/H+ antiporter MnhD subunit
MSKDFTANRKRLIILICSFTVLLISSLLYIIDEDIIKLLFSGTSATYAVNLVYNNVLLVFSFAFLVIIFAFLYCSKEDTHRIFVTGF